MNVLELKQILEKLNPQADIKLINGREPIFCDYASNDTTLVVLSSRLPIGKTTDNELCFDEVNSDLKKEYPFYCPSKDENMFDFEINK